MQAEMTVCFVLFLAFNIEPAMNSEFWFAPLNVSNFHYREYILQVAIGLVFIAVNMMAKQMCPPT